MQPPIKPSTYRMLSALDQRLIDAIYADNPVRVEEALKQGAPPEVQGTNGNLPLHVAAMSAGPEVMRLLLARGVASNPANQDGMTPLKLAVTRGRLENVKILVEAGVSVNPDVPPGCGTLLHMSLSRNEDIAIYLLSQGADMTKQSCGRLPLYQAIAWRKYRAVDEMMARGCDIDQRDDKGMTLLMHAAESGDVDVAVFLLERGADPNAVNGGKTPLACAFTLNRWQEIVKVLLRGGADPARAENEGLLKKGNAEVQGVFNDAARLRHEYLEERAAPFREGSAAAVSIRKPLCLQKQAV